MDLTREKFQEAGQALFDSYIEQERGCVTCGGPCEGVGCFVPFDQDAHGAPSSKLRTFFYPVCLNCYHDDEKQFIVEAYILKHFETEH